FRPDYLIGQRERIQRLIDEGRFGLDPAQARNLINTINDRIDEAEAAQREAERRRQQEEYERRGGTDRTLYGERRLDEREKRDIKEDIRRLARGEAGAGQVYDEYFNRM